MKALASWVLSFTLLSFGCGRTNLADLEDEDAAASVDAEPTTSDARDSSAVDHEDAPVDAPSVVDPGPPVDVVGPGDVLAANIPVVKMALSADEVFWSDGLASVYAVKKTGGPIRKVNSAPLGSPGPIAIGGSSLYVGHGAGTSWAIGRLPLAGGAVTNLVKSELPPVGVVVGGGRLWWLTSRIPDGALWGANLDGTAYFMASPNGQLTGDLFATETDAYFHTGDWMKTIMKYTFATGAREYSWSKPEMYGIAVYGETIYSLVDVDDAQTALYRYLPSAVKLAFEAKVTKYAGCVVADAAHLYFQLPSSGILRMPRGGGASEPFASAPGSTIPAMVHDATRIYWGEQTPSGHWAVRAAAK